MPKREGLKIMEIRQSAAKLRIEERSTTIPREGSRDKRLEVVSPKGIKNTHG